MTVAVTKVSPAAHTKAARNKSKLETTEYGDLSPGSSARPTRNFPDLVTLS